MMRKRKGSKANKENVSRFGCSYTLDLTAHTCNEKISITIY